MASVEEQGGPVAKRDNAFSRVVGAVVSPRETFQSVARKPGWVLPVLLLIVVNLIVGFSVIRTGALRAGMEKQMESNPAIAQMNAQLSPAQRQQNLDLRMRVAPVTTYAGAIVGTPIVLLIVAAVLLGAFNIVFGAGIRFGQSFAVSAYAAMPSLLGGLVSLVLLWVRPPGAVNLQSLSMSSLAAYLPHGAPLWLVSLGGHLDVFTFWTIGLLAVGYAAASSKKKVRFGSALAVVVVVWLIYVLGAVGLTASVASMLPRP